MVNAVTDKSTAAPPPAPTRYQIRLSCAILFDLLEDHQEALVEAIPPCSISDHAVPTKMRRPAPDPLEPPMIARRLIATRKAVGVTQAELCRRADIKPNAYNHWEKGHGRPSLDQAVRLVQTLGITLDWIYLGNLSGVPHGLASQIATHMLPSDSSSE